MRFRQSTHGHGERPGLQLMGAILENEKGLPPEERVEVLSSRHAHGSHAWTNARLFPSLFALAVLHGAFPKQEAAGLKEQLAQGPAEGTP